MDHKNTRRACHHCDRREISDWIVGYVALYDRGEPQVITADKQRVPVRGGIGHDFPREIRTASIVYDHVLAQRTGNSLRDQARCEIEPSAGRKSHNAYRLVGIILPADEARA